MKNFIEIGKTEEEQVEQIKNWIKKNGWSIIAGLVIGFGSISGWDYYQDYQQQRAVEARSMYLSLVNSSATNAQLIAADIQKNHPESTYVQYANLMLAKNAVAAKNYPQALGYLQPLFEDENQIIAHTARLRASSIYLASGDYDQALSVIETRGLVQKNSFDGLYNNLKGDIYWAKKDLNTAKEYYQLAVNMLPNNSELKRLVLIKLNDIN